MDFGRSNSIDARQSTFNHVDGDYHQHYLHQHYHIYISPSDSRRKRHHIAVDISKDLPRRKHTPRILPRRRLDAAPSHAVVVVDLAVDLIDQFVELMNDFRDSSISYRDLRLELQSLQITLTLSRLAIQQFDNKPLGQSLANAITPEILRCLVVLQESLHGFNGAWLGFDITSVGGCQRRIWCGGQDRYDLTSLRRKLSGSRQLLQGLLMALHSYVSLVIRDMMSTNTQAHLKCCMDGGRKRVSRWLSIPSRVPPFI
jgi:hypothetical protein